MNTLASPSARTTSHKFELLRPGAGHVAELARICYDAFGQLHDRHAFQRDFPNREVAEMLIGLFVSQPDIYGVAACVDGRLVGSNFLMVMDTVAGIGPITMDPAWQGKGVGRALMLAVLDEAKRRGVSQVRLVQETFNTTSAPLYASVGFDVREPLGLMNIAPAPAPNECVRPFIEADWPAIDALCREHYKANRLNELKVWTASRYPMFVLERGGRLRGYFLASKLGHGVAETVDDGLTLLAQAARHLPSEFQSFLCPMRHSEFYRGCLNAGFRLAKVLTLMSRGPYDPPTGVWIPSHMY